MNRDTLYLLDPYCHVVDGFARYCPDCALVEGYLAFYPVGTGHTSLVAACHCEHQGV